MLRFDVQGVVHIGKEAGPMTVAAQQGASPVSRVIQPKPNEGKGLNVTIRMPEKLVDRVDEVARSSGWSRSEVLVQFTRWALEEHHREENEPNPENERALEEAQKAADAAEASVASRLKRPAR